MKQLYHSAMYDTDPVPSYWEATVDPRPRLGAKLESDENCDVAIIGGGYTGLCAALHLVRDHGLSVRLFESGKIGWGASGRNGGFNCMPATKMSIATMKARVGLEETRRFWKMQLDGVAFTRRLIAEENIDCDAMGDGIWEVAHRPQAFSDLKSYGAQVKELVGVDYKIYDSEEFGRIGYRSKEQYGAIKQHVGFALHPLKFALGIGQAAEKNGAFLHPDSEVVCWEKVGNKHRLHTVCGAVLADKVLMASNGFTKEGMHRSFDKRLLPVLSNIVVTRPLNAAEMKAHNWQLNGPVCNTRNMLFYYRMLPGNRFLLGARGDMTGKARDGYAMQNWMQKRIGDVFPAWRQAEIAYFWRGFVCMTRNLAPSLGRLVEDPSIYFGYGYHANGVNSAPWSGRFLARMIAGQADEEDIPAVMRGNARKFPFAFLRLWYLRAAKAYYYWQDEY